MKADPNPRPDPPGATGGLAECTIDHAGTEMSYTLQVSEDGRSLEIEFRDGSCKTIPVTRTGRIMGAMPSVEGTVIACYLANSHRRFYNVNTGLRLREDEEELRRINPHFYA